MTFAHEMGEHDKTSPGTGRIKIACSIHPLHEFWGKIKNMLTHIPNKIIHAEILN